MNQPIKNQDPGFTMLVTVPDFITAPPRRDSDEAIELLTRIYEIYKTGAATQLFENQVFTVEEVARLLKVSSKTIYKYVRQETIPFKRLSDGTIRFLLPVLLSWMKGDIHER